MVAAKASKQQQEADKLQQEIDQLERDLRGLRESSSARQKQIGKLEAEQRSLLLEARVKKNSEAQGRIDSLFEIIAALRREDLFDYAAIEEQSQKLEMEKAELDSKQWRARCEKVKELVREHLREDFDGRLEHAVGELREAHAALAESEKAISSALNGLHSSLYPLAQEVGYYMAQRRQWSNAYSLREALGVPVREVPPGGAYGKQVAVKWMTTLMERIDALEGPDARDARHHQG